MAEEQSVPEEPGTARKTCTLSLVTLRRLEKLAENGSWGTKVPAVMTALIEAGIRQAMKDGFLKVDD